MSDSSEPTPGTAAGPEPVAEATVFVPGQSITASAGWAQVAEAAADALGGGAGLGGIGLLGKSIVESVRDVRIDRTRQEHETRRYETGQVHETAREAIRQAGN